MVAKCDVVNSEAGGKPYTVYIGNNIFDTFSYEFFDRDSITFILSKVVYDKHKQYIDTLMNEIQDYSNKPVHTIEMDDAEENKSYYYAESFLEKFISLKMNRKSIIVAIGGGVVGDFSGYLASLFMRGIPIIHIPSTILAMVDSSLGGKVAVNLSLGKNMVGAFHQPAMVMSDVSLLKTLPDHEWKNGLTEALKHGLIGDKRTIEIFDNNDFESIKSERTIQELIKQSVKFKISVVEQDEKEGGLRAILNFGHTVGHAIESLLEYKGISHGQAVALGILVKVDVAKRMGWVTAEESNWVKMILKRYDLIHSVDVSPEAVLEHMQYDKKNTGGKINFVMIKGIGNPEYNVKLDERIVLESLHEVLK